MNNILIIKMAMSITEGLIRLSIGIEDFSNMKDDIIRAL